MHIKNKHITFIILGFISIISLSFGSFNTKLFDNLNKRGFNFEGTNSLFIETNNGLKFNWVTTNKTDGIYELISQNKTIITKGKTEIGQVHSISLDYKIEENIVFRFGGKNESINEVKLRPLSSKNKSIFKNIDSLFVVGDVHGRYNELINLLQKSHVIDKDLNWVAGKSHLVFLGDLFDRGNNVTKVLWFIYELEQKAELAEGKVHLVLGNHEIMTMTKDLRYISAKEATIAGVYRIKYDYMFHPTKSFLGSWLSSKPSVLKIDKNLFAHGGIVDLGTNSIKEFNQTVHSYIHDPMFLDIMQDYPDSTKYDPQEWRKMNNFFYNENSPFWYRGYVNYDTLGPQLNAMLKKYQSKIHIVAHTPLETITQRYKGKLLTTDLNDAATQLLLLVRDKKKYSKFIIDSSGIVSELK